jgi:hypothetical protein
MTTHTTQPAEQAAPVRFPAPVPTMTVRVIDRSGWGTSAPYPLIRTVTVPAVCPKCGGPRGVDTIRGHNFMENDDSHHVHNWDNPCGHLDRYEDVLAEALAWRTVTEATDATGRVTIEQYGDRIALVVTPELVGWVYDMLKACPTFPDRQPPVGAPAEVSS